MALLLLSLSAIALAVGELQPQAATLAGPPSLVWAASAGGTNNDNASGLAVDLSGNVYLAGACSGPTANIGGIVLSNQGNQSFGIVCKFAPAGDVLWVRQIGSSNTSANAVATDPSGSVYVAGSLIGTVNLGNTNVTASSQALFIARYDSAGTLLWIRADGNGALGYAAAVAVDAEGTPCVAGSFSGVTATFGSFILTNRGTSDAFVAKYSPAGELLWARGAGGSENDEVNAIAVDLAGNILIAGSFSSTNALFGTISLKSQGNTDVFVAKYSPDGEALWATRIGGSRDDNGYGMGVDGQGFSTVVGSFNGTAGFGSTNLQTAAFDAFVTRLDPTGTVIWARQVGTTNNTQFESAYAVAVASAGTSLVTGLIVGSTTFGATNLFATNQQLSLVSYNASGEVQWAAQAGGNSGVDIPRAVVRAPGGAIYFAGYFGTTAAFGGTNLSSRGGVDIFLARRGGIDPPPDGQPLILVNGQTNTSNYFRLPATNYIEVEIVSSFDPVELRFTTDGSIPNSGSPRYVAPLRVSTSIDIQAIAYDALFDEALSDPVHIELVPVYRLSIATLGGGVVLEP